jgi:hypothetical protein
VQKIWDVAEEKLTTDEINNKLLLATDKWRRTVLKLTAECGKIDLLEKIREWAIKNVTTEEMNNKLLLATDNKGMTVWQVVAKCDKVKPLQKIWNLAKEKTNDRGGI